MKQFYLLATYLWSLWSVKMASVAEAKRSFWTLVNLWKAKKSATLTLKSVKGDLRVSFSVSLGQHEHEKLEDMKTRQSLKRDASSSKQRRKQRRAADPAVELKLMLLLKLKQQPLSLKKRKSRLSEVRSQLKSLPLLPLLKRNLLGRSWWMSLVMMDSVSLWKCLMTSELLITTMDLKRWRKR